MLCIGTHVNKHEFINLVSEGVFGLLFFQNSTSLVLKIRKQLTIKSGGERELFIWIVDPNAKIENGICLLNPSCSSKCFEASRFCNPHCPLLSVAEENGHVLVWHWGQGTCQDTDQKCLSFTCGELLENNLRVAQFYNTQCWANLDETLKKNKNKN